MAEVIPTLPFLPLARSYAAGPWRVGPADSFGGGWAEPRDEKAVLGGLAHLFGEAAKVALIVHETSPAGLWDEDHEPDLYRAPLPA